jgi:hypothetical protein
VTKITSAIAAALVASASFASVALAQEGDYYEGASAPVASHQVPAAYGSNHSVSYGYTGSIARSAQGYDANGTVVINRGDYYEGANRPN